MTKISRIFRKIIFVMYLLINMINNEKFLFYQKIVITEY